MSILPFVLGGSALLDMLDSNDEDKFRQGVNRSGISYLQRVMRGEDGYDPMAEMRATDIAMRPKIDELGSRIDENLGFNTGRGQKLLMDQTLSPLMGSYADGYRNKYRSALQAAMALSGYGGG